MGRDSGFATSGGSGIKSFFMAGNGISRHRRDRDLDYFAFFGGIQNIIPSILPFGSLDWPIQNSSSYIQTKETEFKHKHSLRSSSFISPFLGKFLPFDRQLRQTSLTVSPICSLINFSSRYHTYLFY